MAESGVLNMYEIKDGPHKITKTCTTSIGDKVIVRTLTVEAPSVVQAVRLMEHAQWEPVQSDPAKR